MLLLCVSMRVPVLYHVCQLVPSFGTSCTPIPKLFPFAHPVILLLLPDVSSCVRLNVAPLCFYACSCSLSCLSTCSKLWNILHSYSETFPLRSPRYFASAS